MGTLQFFKCADVNHTAEVVSPNEGKYLKFHSFQCDKILSIYYQPQKVISIIELILLQIYYSGN